MVAVDGERDWVRRSRERDSFRLQGGKIKDSSHGKGDAK